MDVWLSGSSCDGRRPIGRRITGNMRLWHRTATDRSQDCWRHERSGVEGQLISHRIAGDMSALASKGNWSVAGSLATWALWRRRATDQSQDRWQHEALASNGNWSVAGSLATWAFWRRTATDRSQDRWRHERSDVERQLIGRRIAGDMSALASKGNWSVAGSLATWALWRRTATDRSQDPWQHERSGVERQLIGRRIAGDMSALASKGNWSVTGSLATWGSGIERQLIGAGSLATWALWRRRATDRRLVGVKFLKVECVLLLCPGATSCRSTQGDMSVLASTYVWSRPTWAHLRLIVTCCSKAAIDLRFGWSENSCVASCRQLRQKAVDLRLPLDNHHSVKRYNWCLYYIYMYNDNVHKINTTDYEKWITLPIPRHKRYLNNKDV